MDPRIYGFSESRCVAAFQHAYEKANKCALHIRHLILGDDFLTDTFLSLHEAWGHVDLILGPSWPSGCLVYTPDSPKR